jgi:hypothetical protein
MSGGFSPRLPGGMAWRGNGGDRDLTGDRKTLGAAPAAIQLIDVEYEIPDFYVVMGVSRFSVNWRISYGIDRAAIRTFEVGGDSFFYVVSARSISLIAQAGTPDPVNPVTAIIAPCSFTTMEALGVFVNRAYQLQENIDPVGLTPGIGLAPLFAFDIGVPSSVAASVVSVQLAAGSGEAKGYTIYNDSASANLYISLGSTAASLTSFTAKLVPGAYYETPFGYNGPIQGIWDAAIGSARISTVLDG